ncbi:MarR family transcriptional regulator [Geodermatophilus sp. TF02-6]|uniref:MarR family winged helix-turn-helix transcriptional regulator n=1 Tax=Geodermatophilus sp. TF02-6 TaxID=2250575 RepID=UPI000DE9311B|nr:MarR family winged helix-turn-helix transcriptional regulator [Geodermatophilus sp. TF02-6]RBY76033.1 MarR family transcriptional regulator [Geodermatophilus sp. TF02-6]
MELPPDAIPTPMPTVIDSEDFTPRLLSLLSNSLVWRESRALRKRFGLGTNDWRVISAIAIRPGVTASEISEFIAVNKAIVSKSVGVLTGRGLIVQVEDTGRSRQLFLTAAGAEMHDAMLPISMRGQEIILADLSAEDVVRLNQLLRRLLSRVRELQVEDALDEPGDAELA